MFKPEWVDQLDEEKGGEYIATVIYPRIMCILKVFGRVNRRFDLLDVNCGLGQMVGMLTDAGFKAFGIEHNEEAKEHFDPPQNFMLYDGEKIPFDDESFDTVSCFDFPEDYEPLLRECRRVSRGALFCYFGKMNQERFEEVSRVFLTNRLAIVDFNTYNAVFTLGKIKGE